MKNDSEVITVLILERGASWPSWATGLRMKAPNAIVEVQLEAESVDAFEARVLEKLRKSQERGDYVIGAGYACGLSNGSRDASRLRIGEVLVDVLRRPPSDDVVHRANTRFGESEVGTGEAELILAGGAWDFAGEDAEERGRVLELWSHLSSVSPGKVVSVRFEERPYDSGVFRVAYEKEAGALSG